MNNQNWIDQKIRVGRALVAAGIVLSVAGALLQWFPGDLSFNPRIVTGLGILLAGIGVGNLVKYGAARRDPQGAGRQLRAGNDERSRMLRGRAGNLAFIVSTVMTYALLMWLSFASSGSLPEPTLDTLWYGLAAAVIVPFIVYSGSIVVDERKM